MAEDFRQLSSENSLSQNHEGSTSLLLFKEELEVQETLEPGKCEINSNNAENYDSEECSRDSTRRCTTPEEDSIPASVRELLYLLVNRASRNENEELLVEELPPETSKVRVQDESWTSSMVTPSKSNSAISEINDSTLINFKFEASDIEVSEDKNNVVRANVISIDQQEEDGIYNISLGFIDPNSTTVSVTNNPFLKQEGSHCNYKPKDINSESFDDLSLLSNVALGQRKVDLSIKNPDVIECPDSSFLEAGINTSVVDGNAESGVNFLMSTPVKECSKVSINFNPSKYSFDTVTLLSEGDNVCDKSQDNSVLEKHYRDHLVKVDVGIGSLLPNNNLEDSSEEKQNFFLDNSSRFNDSIHKNDHSLTNSNLNNHSQDIPYEVNEGNSLNVTDEPSTVIIAADKVVAEACNDHNNTCSSEEIIQRTCSNGALDIVCKTQPISALVVSENESKNEGVNSNDHTICNADEMETVIVGDYSTCIQRDLCASEHNFHTTEPPTAVAMDCSISTSDGIFTGETLPLCITEEKATLSSKGNTIIDEEKCNDEQFFCGTDLMATVMVNSNDDTECVSVSDREIICDTEQMKTVILGDSYSSIKDIENSNQKPSDVEKIEVNLELRSTSIDMLSPFESSIIITDKMECVIEDENNQKSACKSGIGEDIQSSMMRKDMSEVGYSSRSKVQEECFTDDKVIESANRKIEVKVNMAKEMPRYVTQTLDILLSPVRSHGSQEMVLQKNCKSSDLLDTHNCRHSEKPQCANEFECSKESDTVLSRKDIISPDICIETVPDVSDIQGKIDKSDINKGEIPPKIHGVCSIKEDSNHSKCNEEKFIEEELKVDGKVQKFSKPVINEVNHKLVINDASGPKSVNEEFNSCELNNTIMENFFSETMNFDYDNIVEQSQDSSIQNPSVGNSVDIFSRVYSPSVPDVQSKTLDTRDSVVDCDVAIKKEPEDDDQSPIKIFSSQDYLSCSVLEEVCQATEALAYYGKGKNECPLDDGMEIEFLNDNHDKLETVETDKQRWEEKKQDNKKKIKSESNIRNASSCNSHIIIPESIMSANYFQNISTVIKTEPVSEEECVRKEEDSKQNLKKKILFTVQDCITLDDDMESWEVELGTEKAVKVIKQENDSISTAEISFPVQVKETHELKIEDGPAFSKGDVFKNSSKDKAKTFIYPKHGKKLNNLIQERVKVEDLMASAVALEKCSNFLPKAKSADIKQLKNESLVCFNTLEANMSQMVSQKMEDETLKSSGMIFHGKSENSERKASSDDKQSDIDQMNDDSDEISYLLAAAIEGEKSLKTVLCDVNLSENEIINNDSKENFTGSLLCKTNQDINVTVLKEKEVVQDDKESESKDEQCTSPILKKRKRTRQNFRRNDKISCVTPKPYEPVREKSPDVNRSLIMQNIFPLHKESMKGETESHLLIEKNMEESCNVNSFCKDLKVLPSPGENFSSMTKNSDRINSHESLKFQQEKDLLSEKETPYRRSNSEFSTGSGNKVSVPENAPIVSNKLFDEGSNYLKRESMEYSTTGENESLLKRKKLVTLKTVLKDYSTPTRSDSFRPSLASDKKFAPHEKSVLRDKISTPSSSGLKGFSTASGKKVSVSEKALLKVKKIFSEEDLSGLDADKCSVDKNRESIFENISTPVQDTTSLQVEKLCPDENSPNIGFSTASGKKVLVSEKALKQAEKIFSEETVLIGNKETGGDFLDIENKMCAQKKDYTEECKISLEDLTPVREAESYSLSATGRKKFSFSGKSRLRAKKNMLEDNTPARSEPVKISTTNGMKKPNSEKDLVKAKNLFSEETVPISREDFTTKYGEILSSIDENPKKITPARWKESVGFSTASHEKVEVTENMLINCKKFHSEGTTSAIQDFQDKQIPYEDVTPSRGTYTCGFSTATGKKVEISEKALMQAKNLFAEETTSAIQDCQKKQIPIEDATPASATNTFGFSTGTGKKVAVSEKALMQAKNLFAEETTSAIQDYQKKQIPIEDVTPARATNSFGFSTATGKKVAVSEKALMQAKNLFAEETTSAIQDCQKKQIPMEDVTPARATNRFGFSTATGKKVAVSEKALMQAKNLFAEETTSAMQDYQKKQIPIEDVTPARATNTFGFSTATGKKVAISEKALMQAKNLFAEETTSAMRDYQKKEIPIEDVTPASATNTFGFSTGTGKKVAVSEKALMQAKNLFAEETSSAIQDYQKKQFPIEDVTPARATNTFGFSTGTGKKVAVSEKALMQAKNLFAEETTSAMRDYQKKEIPIDDATPARGTNTFGFSTGTGKKVAVSEKALMQAKNLFAEETTSAMRDYQKKEIPIDDATPARGTNTFGFSTGTGKKVAVSEKALMQAKNLFAEETSSAIQDYQKKQFPIEDVTPARATNTFGFSTGTGKKVAVSEKALMQAKNLFAEETTLAIQDFQKKQIPIEDVTPSRGTNTFGFSTATGKKVAVSEKSLLQAKNLFSEESTPSRSDTLGFSTASGKKVSVSEKALMQSRNLFSEEILSVTPDSLMADAEKGISEIESSFTLAKISSGGVIPAREAITTGVSKGSGKRFASPAKYSTPSNVKSLGFSTASGKKVSVSEKALMEAKKQFIEESHSDVGECSSKVCPETENQVNVDENFTNANKVSPEYYSTPTRGTNSPSFSTATGKSVLVSEKSLSKAQKLFSEECLAVTPDSTDNQETALANKYGDTPLPLKSVLKRTTLNLKKNSPVVARVMGSYKTPKENLSSSVEGNLDQKLQSGQKLSFSKSRHFKPNAESSMISSTSKNAIDEKCGLNNTLDTLFAESQGDNYIKAVNLSSLDSPAVNSVVDDPPSPVFKITNRRRKRFKAVSSSQMIDKESFSKVSTPDISISSTNGSFEGDTVSGKCAQTPCPTIQKDEGNVRVLDMELWDNDLAEESLLGKQLDLAEASNLLERNSPKVDIWDAARKRQGETISLKKNVRPVIGKHLQERKSKGPLLRHNLRDLMKGKRPGRYSKEQLRKFNIKESTLNVTAKNAAEFQFFLKDHYRENIKPRGIQVEDGIILIPNPKGIFGVTEAQAALLAAPGVDPKLLPPGGWCQNHYRWIVWKLACSERSFPEELGGRYLTPENVMRQLKYRWDREIDRGERPALRKILEMDDTASKRMILCVSSIQKPENIQACKKLELDLISSSARLELTDGWYAICGVIDTEMAALLQNGKLSIGTKIVTSGAELINGPSNGCHPLEPPAAKAAIRLNTNSTRRARWDAKLGYVFKNPGPLPITLGSLLPGGGTVSALRNVILARAYPILNVEKTPDGRKVVRSQKAEARAAAKYECQRQIWLENIYSQVSAEIQKEEDEEAKIRHQGKRARSWQTTPNNNSKRPRRSLPSGGRSSEALSPEDLLKLVEESEDSSSFQSLLTSSQLNMVMAYKEEERERRRRELEDRVKQRIKEEEEKSSTPEKTHSPVVNSKHSAGKFKRDVVAVFKARLVDADRPVLSKSAVLTIWRPSEEVVCLFAKEGVSLTVYNVSSNGMRSGFLQLSSTRQTRYKVNTGFDACQVDKFPSLQRVILRRGFDDYNSQKGSGFGSSSDSLPPFGEIDLVAMVIRIGDEPNKEKGLGFQNVFVAGSDGSLLSIAFWGGILEFAVNDILLPGVIVVASNLQWRRHHGLSRIPTVHAVETSIFTQNPCEERLKIVLKNFQNELKEEMQLEDSRSDFLHYCEEKLAVVTHQSNKDDNSKLLATSNFCMKSGLSVSSPIEKLTPIRPSVAARMKKLQMYEGAAEISLPVCHVKATTSAMKAFQPPTRCDLPKSCYTVHKTCEVLHSDNNSSPMSLDSELE